MRYFKYVLVLGMMGISSAAYAASERSSAVTREFQKLHPCPSTGRRSGPCPGMIKDHRVPICLGQEFDRVDNLTWQTYEDSLRKDRIEREICRFYRGFTKERALRP